MSDRSVDGGAVSSFDILRARNLFRIIYTNFYLYTHREMAPQRLARVSEMNEEGSENEAEDGAAESSQKKKNRSSRNPNQLHVTINTKPEEISDCDGNSSQHSNGTTGSNNRRPSVLIQEILSSRRPSAIMAAIRSPKQFVNRYRREYVFD